MPEGTE